MKNAYFDSDQCEFEVVAFYEELLEPETGKMIGTRLIAEPTRPLGSDGRIEYLITENLVLKKGTKEVILKASPKKPKRVCAMIQVLCGFTKRALAEEKARAAQQSPPTQ